MKALCYRAKALYHLGCYRESLVYAKSAISLQPNQAMMKLIQASEDRLDEEYLSVFHKHNTNDDHLSGGVEIKVNGGKKISINSDKTSNKSDNEINKLDKNNDSITNFYGSNFRAFGFILKIFKIFTWISLENIKKNKFLFTMFTLILFFILKKRKFLYNLIDGIFF